MKAVRIWFLPLVALAFVACGGRNGGGGKSSSGGGGQPKALAVNTQLLNEIHKAKPVSPALAERVKTLRAFTQSVPAPELYFSSNLKSEPSYRLLSQDGQRYAEQILHTCRLDHEPVNPPWSGKWVANTEISRSFEGKVSGKTCPIEYGKTTTSKNKINEINAKTHQYTGTTTDDISSVLDITDSNLKTKAAYSKLEIRRHSQAMGDKVTIDNDVVVAGAVKTITQYTGRLLIAAGASVAIEGSAEISEAKGLITQATLLTFKFAEGEFPIAYVEKNGDRQYFVNGQAYPPEKFQQEFSAIFAFLP